ncbi:ATP-grasp domain-containing protein [Carboxylicivirga mesophila]|uniref:ATP-grasp domain-containing protein n=1 Tax=Carboxylicivirga mesophila TaxID=1166478 RepID=A0ABS5K4L9_9BACT|nr:ATP-grasp domain-containing protein [Carboxylicivirga mesophila]MBS2209961.1 ATP-grasp domain-containing protein [Carboxylicivirga mesophila]
MIADKKKKILVLPAIFDHVDLIIEAKNNGYHVITCDNQVNNVGHSYSDEVALIDLLDHKSMLKFSLDMGIDAIISFSTDIGAVPAALVADKLQLPGAGYKAVDIMANKDKFRKFQKENGLSFPAYQVVSCYEELDGTTLDFPVVVKPIDRAGSKGVSVVNSLSELKTKLPFAVNLSLKGKVIVERFISSEYHQVHGDVIVQNGEIIFSCLGDQVFNTFGGRCLPIATLFPTSISKRIYDKIISQLQHFVTLVGYKNGGINVEVRVGNAGNICFIELGPRFGGNFIPKTIGLACGINLTRFAINLANGIPISIGNYTVNPRIFQFILRADRLGCFKGVILKNTDEFSVLSEFTQYNINDRIENLDGPSSIVGIYVIEAVTKSLRGRIVENHIDFFEIKIV